MTVNGTFTLNGGTPVVLLNNTITVNGLMSGILAFTLSNTPVPAGNWC